MNGDKVSEMEAFTKGNNEEGSEVNSSSFLYKVKMGGRAYIFLLELPQIRSLLEKNLQDFDLIRAAADRRVFGRIAGECSHINALECASVWIVCIFDYIRLHLRLTVTSRSVIQRLHHCR